MTKTRHLKRRAGLPATPSQGPRPRYRALRVVWPNRAFVPTREQFPLECRSVGKFRGQGRVEIVARDTHLYVLASFLERSLETRHRGASAGCIYVDVDVDVDVDHIGVEIVTRDTHLSVLPCSWRGVWRRATAALPPSCIYTSSVTL